MKIAGKIFKVRGQRSRSQRGQANSACVSSLLSGGISMKLATNIYHVSWN